MWTFQSCKWKLGRNKETVKKDKHLRLYRTWREIYRLATIDKAMSKLLFSRAGPILITKYTTNKWDANVPVIRQTLSKSLMYTVPVLVIVPWCTESVLWMSWIFSNFFPVEMLCASMSCNAKLQWKTRCYFRSGFQLRFSTLLGSGLKKGLI